MEGSTYGKMVLKNVPCKECKTIVPRLRIKGDTRCPTCKRLRKYAKRLGVKEY